MQTEITAKNWVDKVVKERGIKEAINLLTYNLTRNQYFRESNNWVTCAWNILNELNPS
jgi:hypothetical protein